MNHTDIRPLIGITAGTREDWQPNGPRYLPYAAVPGLGGGTPVYIGADDAARLDGCDGLLISGGNDIHPDRYDRMPGDDALTADDVIAKYKMGVESERDHHEFLLIARALEIGMPILGICRGLQSLNVVMGGRLVPDISACIPRALVHTAEWDGQGARHEVSLEPGSVVERIYSARTLSVNSYHHQGLTRDMIAPGLKMTAVAPDGVVEAVEAIDIPFVVAVQWHPERQRDAFIHDRSVALFRAFVDACRA